MTLPVRYIFLPVQSRIIMKTADAYYLYDEAVILENLRILTQTYPNFRFFYSAKTNPNPHVLKTLIKNDCGIDAASAGEVRLAVKHGLTPDKITYSAPGKTDEDIRYALPRSRLIADSIAELVRIDKIAGELEGTFEIGIRINPPFSMDSPYGVPSQFGIDYELLEFLPELFNTKIVSIHTHIQSQNLGWETLARYYENVLSLAREMKKKGFTVNTINFGSGCGIVYDESSQTPLDMEALGSAVRKLTEKYADVSRDLIIEPGRYLVGKAGVFRTRVIDRKISRGKTYVIASGGMNGFLRPAAANIAKIYGPVSRGAEPLISCENPCGITVLNESKDTETVTITGNLCSGFDVFARDITLPKMAVGDYIEFSNAGSYACTLSLREFASQPKVKEFFRTIDGEVLE